MTDDDYTPKIPVTRVAYVTPIPVQTFAYSTFKAWRDSPRAAPPHDPPADDKPPS